MKPVKIRCPICPGIGYVEIDSNLIENNERGITAINIDNRNICNHSFVVYLDRNYDVRDSFCADFKVALPEIELEKTIDGIKIEDINLYLLFINLQAVTFAYLLRCIFLKKQLVILSNLEHIESNFNNFITYAFQDSFETNITMINRNDYKKNKKSYKNSIVIEGKKVHDDKDDILNPKKLKIELAIVQKFLAENNEIASLIILKNEIQKAFQLSKEITEFNNNLKKDDEFSSKLMLDHFFETRKIKVSFDYLKFLIEIVKNYFSVELKISSTVSDFLAF